MARSGLRYRQHHGLYPRGFAGAGSGRQQISACLAAGLLDFAQVCGVLFPEEIIRGQLQALEQVLARSVELIEQAPNVVIAIQRYAEAFSQTFG